MTMRTATWFPTWKCNLECPYCCIANDKRHVTDGSVPSHELIRGLRNLDLDILDISGGEPFMFPELFAVMSALSSTKTRMALTTNATRSYEIERLAKVFTNENIISWTLSWHPSSTLQSRFWETVVFLQCLGYHVTVNHVLFPGQVMSADFCRDKCSFFNVTYHADLYRFPPDNPPTYTAEELKVISEFVKPDRTLWPHKTANCSAGHDRFIITPNGDIFPCLKSAFANVDVIGNIRLTQKRIVGPFIHCDDISVCAGCDRDKVTLRDLGKELADVLSTP